jgi:hypothetical protein
MLAYFKILEEYPHTGTMIVHWIKKVWCINYAQSCVCWYPVSTFLFEHVSLIEKRFPCPICSSHFSVVIENISLVEEYGMLGRHIIAWPRYWWRHLVIVACCCLLSLFVSSSFFWRTGPYLFCLFY